MDFAGVSARLRALRQEQHLTQKVLAGRLGVTTDDLLGRSSGRPPPSVRIPHCPPGSPAQSRASPQNPRRAHCQASSTIRRRADKTTDPSPRRRLRPLRPEGVPIFIRKMSAAVYVHKRLRRPAPSGAPQKRSFCGERKNKWSGADVPRRGTERSEICSDEEARPVSFSAEKETVPALRRSRKSAPAGRRTPRAGP